MVENKSTRRPLIDPLLLTLKSRRVLIAISTLLIGVLVLAVPQLVTVQGELLVLLITLALAVIGGYSIEDAASAGREQAETPLPDELEALVRVILLELLREEEAEKETNDE